MQILQFKTREGLKQFKLGGAPVTVGRDPSNSLAFADDSLTPFHCIIEPVADGYRVRDLNSVTGVYINGEKAANRVLRSGDRIKVGAATLVYAEVTGKSRDEETSGARTMTVPGARAGVEKEREADDGKKVMADLGPREVTLSEVIQAAGQHLKKLGGLLSELPPTGIAEADLILLNAKGFRSPPFIATDVRQLVKSGNDGLFFLRCLLVACVRMRATDLHIEPKGDVFVVRARVDGAMLEAVQLHAFIGQRVQRVVKVLCEQDISKTNTIQEGQFSMDVPGRRIHYRVNFTPSMHGQKLAIRILDEAIQPLKLAELGMPPWMEKDLQNLIEQESGVIIVSGPTGSGKTTTLYALIREIDRFSRNVVTLESPVEFEIEGITQLPINEMHGQSYATILPSVLRQDPDVLLVGEVREADTARIVMQAAMTGHLCLSTVHARDSVGTVFRLLDLGVDPTLLAAALNRALSQRLVRKLCAECRRPRGATEVETAEFVAARIEPARQVFEPVGCGACVGTGYAGRCAIYELLNITDQVRNVILNKPQIMQLRDAARATGFITLRESGLRLVAAGQTSFQEIDRVAAMA